MDFAIESLGECTIPSPLRKFKFTDDRERILHNPVAGEADETQSFESAGPREKIYFNPAKSRAAIVTCGGLCPGLNDVIRSLVNTLYYGYGIKDILGIRYGYKGLDPGTEFPPMELDPERVRNIHVFGGTVLGSSRGNPPVEVMAERLRELGVTMFFAIGGDGTLSGALKIHKELKARSIETAVVGVPKTIDNDISFIEKSFGFETAVSTASQAVSAAHTEALGAINGIGIVKLMGRQSGFIAAHAALGMNDVNFVLVPEIPLNLEKGFFPVLENRVRTRGHAVIVIAEGVGQDWFDTDPKNREKDAGGNVRLRDSGLYLKNATAQYFKQKSIPVSIKYIDPSYIIRSVPATVADSTFCIQLAQNAVHSAVAGKTGMLVGIWNNVFTNVPIHAAISRKNNIQPDSVLWRQVVEATGQPVTFE